MIAHGIRAKPLCGLAIAVTSWNGGTGTPSSGVRFSGARNGTAAWSGIASFWLEDGNRALTTMSVGIPVDGDSITVRVDLGGAGEPHTGSFQSAAGDPACYATVQEVLSGAMWSADTNFGNFECRHTCKVTRDRRSGCPTLTPHRLGDDVASALRS